MKVLFEVVGVLAMAGTCLMTGVCMAIWLGNRSLDRRDRKRERAVQAVEELTRQGVYYKPGGRS